ncbi:dihydrofolate reductase family protein [Curtobacterium sp. Leaf261]|uniref:dihydrofolate reductase family protein n=1 Tax=Curtobacterium sp. Leaf261 TaxID=1736311 RepID=UPI0006FCD467|nr:dihydrofolate reductase family protein [Curtobacterium sp. Leaf261]KQO62721.1 deaminase [Curtobacterium sp. Leaf261]
MRKVTAGLFSSVDGVVSEPYRFQYDSFDDELGAGMTALMQSTTTGILGRTSYEEWAGYWPDSAPESDDPFAAFINPLQKFVVSHTLTAPLAWENSTLVDGDLETFVRDLKRGDGDGDISVFGSISVVRQLLFAGLLDELLLMVHPAIAGAGQRLFAADDPATRLELVRGATTSRGNALLTYRPRPTD